MPPIDEHKERMEEIENLLQDVKSRIYQLQLEYKDNTSQISTINTSISRIENIETSFQNVVSHLDQLKLRYKELTLEERQRNTAISQLSIRVTGLSKHVNNLTSETRESISKLTSETRKSVDRLSKRIDDLDNMVKGAIGSITRLRTIIERDSF
jgi:archaellum component FlaC